MAKVVAYAGTVFESAIKAMMELADNKMTEMADLTFKIVAAAVAAYWAFFKWGSEREKDRKLRSALYLNPYLFACEELQSRIWNILDNCGLETLRNRGPDSPNLSYVDETLYLIAQYFGWQHCIYRYYPHDARMIRLALKIRDTFATDYYGKGAFCFFRPEQRFLGQMVMQRSSGEFGGEFDVLTLKDFQQKLGLDCAKHSCIEETRKALSKAESVKSFDSKTHKRLAIIQNDLVALLKHIERKDRVSFFFSGKFKERQKAKMPKA